MCGESRVLCVIVRVLEAGSWFLVHIEVADYARLSFYRRILLGGHYFLDLDSQGTWYPVSKAEIYKRNRVCVFKKAR